jgi:hypothetical protein
MDYNFWVPVMETAIFGLLGLYLTHRQVRFMEAQPGVTPLPKLGFSVKSYWPIAVMILMMGLVWIPFLISRNQASTLARVIEEKRQQAITINSLNSQLQNAQHGPLGTRPITRTLAAPATGISMVQKLVHREDTKYPFELDLELQTDKVREDGVQLLIVCDGQIGEGHGSFKNGKEFSHIGFSEGWLSPPNYYNHPEVFNIKWQNPSWVPGEPIIVKLYSVRRINVNFVVPIKYQPNN